MTYSFKIDYVVVINNLDFVVAMKGTNEYTESASSKTIHNGRIEDLETG